MEQNQKQTLHIPPSKGGSWRPNKTKKQNPKIPGGWWQSRGRMGVGMEGHACEGEQDLEHGALTEQAKQGAGGHGGAGRGGASVAMNSGTASLAVSSWMASMAVTEQTVSSGTAVTGKTLSSGTASMAMTVQTMSSWVTFVAVTWQTLSSWIGATTSGGSAVDAATSGGTRADSWTGEASGEDLWTGEVSEAYSWTGQASGVQCAAHTHKMATAITGSAEVRGTVSVTASAEALGMPAACTDISGGSITLAISPGPSSASAGAWVL